MKIYLVEWIDGDDRGQAVVKASFLTEAIQKLCQYRNLVNGNIVLAGEIESDIHIVKDAGVPF